MQLSGKALALRLQRATQDLAKYNQAIAQQQEVRDRLRITRENLVQEVKLRKNKTKMLKIDSGKMGQKIQDQNMQHLRIQDARERTLKETEHVLLQMKREEIVRE